jgi:hypothetical protein
MCLGFGVGDSGGDTLVGSRLLHGGAYDREGGCEALLCLDARGARVSDGNGDELDFPPIVL